MIELTDFARRRLFPGDGRRTAIQDITPEAFVARLNAEPPVRVIDGYAPFCKLHVHRNWTSTKCSVIAIDDGNRHRLRSAYEARTPAELPVLVRWFDGLEPPVANYLVPILYDREPRHAGETKYPFSKMLRFALDALTGFSSAPLKLASHAGLALSVGSLLLILYIVFAWLSGRSIAGWTSLMLVVVVLGAVQMFVLALMGEYIGRLYNEAKRRPLYIVQEIAGGERRTCTLGQVADATANSDRPGGIGTLPAK